MDIKKSFFDRAKVQKSMDRGTHRALSKGLSYIRTRQRTSINRRKKVSRPGRPPNAHSRDPVASIKNILFAYDARTKSGVVGMVKLNQKQQDWIDSGSLTVPQIMEDGAVVAIHEVATAYSLKKRGRSSNKAWRRRDKRRKARPGDLRRTRRAVYRPRPSAGPALEAEIAAGSIMTPWANVVTG